ITLMRTEPQLVADAIDISRRTTRKIHQNLFWAFGYNVIGIPLAAAGLLSPALAGAAMAFSSVSVLANTLLLRNWQTGEGVDGGHCGGGRGRARCGPADGRRGRRALGRDGEDEPALRAARAAAGPGAHRRRLPPVHPGRRAPAALHPAGADAR